MNIIELIQLIIATFDRGAASTIIQQKILTEKDMNKGRGANRNPFLGGRVEMTKVFSGFVMGTDYSRSLAAAATRIGNETSAEDVKLKPNWHKPLNDGVEGEWFSTDKATESKVYLKLQRNNKQIACKVTVTYKVDGRDATDAEVAAIEGWLKNKSNTQSSTQTELGLTKDNEQFFILPQIETIKSIKQNEREISPMALLHEVHAMAMAVA